MFTRILLLVACVYFMLPFFKETQTEITMMSAKVGGLQETVNYLHENLGIRFPETALAQIFHETNKLTSSICRECNNLTGMKHNSRGYSEGICRGHARYTSWHASLKDYAHWQSIYLSYYERDVIKRTVKTEEQYLDFLEWIGYATDPQYRRAVTWHLARIKRALEYENR